MNCCNRVDCRKVYEYVPPAAKVGATLTSSALLLSQVANPWITLAGTLAATGATLYKIRCSAADPFRKQQLFRRMPENDYDQMKKHADRISLKRIDQRHPGLIRAFKEGQWGHPVFKQEWVPVALKAYFEGHFDQNQLSKLMVYDACLRESTGEVIPIQAIGSEKNMEILREATLGYFTKQELEQFEKTYEDTPEVSQFFLIGTDLLAANGKDAAVANAIRNSHMAFVGPLKNGEKNILFTCKLDGVRKVAVFPPQMFQELLKIKYKTENCLDPLLVFAQADKEVLSNNRTRPIRVPNRYTECPEFIHDGTSATDLAFYLHDMCYHLPIEASIGRVDRHIWIEAAKYFKASRNSSPELVAQVLDRDFRAYSEPNSRNLPRGVKFWLTASKFSGMVSFVMWNQKILDEILGDRDPITLDQIKDAAKIEPQTMRMLLEEKRHSEEKPDLSLLKHRLNRTPFMKPYKI